MVTKNCELTRQRYVDYIRSTYCLGLTTACARRSLGYQDGNEASLDLVRLKLYWEVVKSYRLLVFEFGLLWKRDLISRVEVHTHSRDCWMKRCSGQPATDCA
jgi:hypothetical protein